MRCRLRAELDRRSPELDRLKDEIDEATRKINGLDADVRLLYARFLAIADGHPLATEYELAWQYSSAAMLGDPLRCRTTSNVPRTACVNRSPSVSAVMLLRWFPVDPARRA